MLLSRVASSFSPLLNTRLRLNVTTIVDASGESTFSANHGE